MTAGRDSDGYGPLAHRGSVALHMFIGCGRLLMRCTRLSQPAEDLKPSNTPNVTIHRLQEAIKARAIHPNQPVGDLS